MYKVFISVRNRLAMTCKCLAALKKHSVLPHQIFVYDNLTTNKIDEHFMYLSLLYQKGIISQATFNTTDSTFNAFSKAVACNQFLFNHEQDPNKDKCDFLLFLDNDIIVTPGFDQILKQAWIDVKKYKMNNIKVIGQLPGGIKAKKDLTEKISGFPAKTGKNGGSALWSISPNFAREVGYLDIQPLVGHNKKHDQHYWVKLEHASKGMDYILGLQHTLGIHCGRTAGSVCNTLTRNRNVKESRLNDLIKFGEAEEKIDSLSFDQFYELIKNDKSMIGDW